MKILELFSGSGIMSETFRQRGHETFTVDNTFDADLKKDIMKVELYHLPFNPNVIWASPPCQCFSVASIGTHWKGGKNAYIPATAKCGEALQLLDKTIFLIYQMLKQNSSMIWYIENPRGVMRKVIDKNFKFLNMSNVIRHTVTYCQYGDDRMKPTDIWTNNKNWKPKPMCKNGMSCHISAPRGAKTGTQGLKGSYERSVIPKQLCEEIVTNSV